MADALATIGATGHLDQVLIAGGPAISNDVMNAVKAALPGLTVRRIYGSDRYATSVEWAKITTPYAGGDTVALATGTF